jgi:2-C-methyl-D-erythritol 2,4-cyclodiphosphate synthase
MTKPIMKIGSGVDVHQLVKGRDLIIGGVKIDHEKGLKGHSDADVLIHSVCDAILGAAGLGDIGEHFPDTDPRYKGISSLILLRESLDLLTKTGYEIVNMDCTLFAQAPKLSPHKKQMVQNLAGVLNLDPSLVNIKATTTETLGFVGRKEGIAAQTTILICAT